MNLVKGHSFWYTVLFMLSTKWYEDPKDLIYCADGYTCPCQTLDIVWKK